ncbi:AraC family transcriptional regulator ligand-binding domain-containing protein [Pseudomonas aeruginosa]|nr:AraC family transcriptional regulator ligand-binding domain-containing protein [Pseudomonas aeruginosa]
MHNNAADARYELAQVSTFLLQTLAEVVEGHGVDPARLCRGLGFTVEDLQDPTQRISYRQAVSMIQRALQALPERGLGLWVGHQNVLGTLGLLGHVLSLCRTLRDAFDIGVRYQHSSGGIVTSSVYQQGDTFFVEVECHLPSSEVQVFAIEEFFASLLVYGRALVSPAFEPLGIELIHAAPPYAGRIPAPAGAPGTLRLPAQPHGDRQPLAGHAPAQPQPAGVAPGAGPAGAGKHPGAPETRPGPGGGTGHRPRPKPGQPDRKDFRRTEHEQPHLRRRLAEHGLTFEALLEQVRRGRAMSLLGNPGMSIERITEEVGYRDIRSFRRAFKRWTGVSPATFRSEGTSPLDQVFTLAARR